MAPPDSLSVPINDAAAVPSDGTTYESCALALDAVLSSISAAQASIAKVDADWGSHKMVSPAEVNGVMQQLTELKSRTKASQAALRRVHDLGRHARDLRVVTLWTAVLLLIPTMFALGLEVSGGSDDFTVDCEGVTGLTCFINVSIMVWLCALICRRKLLPALWPRTHSVMLPAKRDKSIGYAVKTLFRFVVMVQLLYLARYWSFDGLSMGGGKVYPNGKGGGEFSRNYCIGEHGVARRLWHLCKMEFLTIMVWELSFLPSSSWDMWLHHIGLILGVAFSTDHNLRGAVAGDGDGDDDDVGPTESGEALDGFAWVLMLGTAFMFAKELTVLFFQHRKPLQPHKQARDLQMAAVVHVVNQLAFYMVLPTIFLVITTMRGHLRALNVVLLGTLLVVMNILEIYIFKVTFSVMKAKKKKARADRLNSLSRASAQDPTQVPAPSPP